MCLLGLYYFRRYIPRPLPLLYWAFVGINLTALIMSNSRTSIVAMIIAIAATGVLTRPTPQKLALSCLFICSGILFFSLIDYDTLFAMIARSGDASEITTGTGRTAIWDVAIQLIQERPWFGWGYAATNSILPAKNADVGFIATHAHNAFLQITLSVGLVGLALFIILMFTKIYYSIKSGEQLNIAFIIFLLIDGLTEPIAFQGIATTTTLVLATVLALNYGVRDETGYRAYQQRLPRSASA
jgi:O-antigen ligase